MFGRETRERLASLEDELLRTRAELSSVRSETTQFISSTSEELSSIFSAEPASSGAAVTPESAMRASTVFACVRLIAGTFVSMPLHVFERVGDIRQRANLPVWWLLNEQPCPLLSAASFWQWMTKDKLLRGDGIAALGRTQGGQVEQIIPLARENVLIERGRDSRLRYYVSDNGEFYGLDQDDVLHFPGFGFDGTRGMSVIKFAAKQAIGTALSAEEFAGKFFANGMVPSGVIEIPGPLKEESTEQLRRSWEKRYAGNRNSHRPLVLTNAAKYTQLSLNAEDAQLLESRKFSVIDIARAFGVPPFMVGETEKTSSWGTGIEQLSIGWLRFGIGPEAVATEQEINRKLWPKSERYFAEFQRAGLLSGDSKTESEVFRQGLGGSNGPGWRTVNEIRRILNLPPIKGGDVLYTPPASGAPQGQGASNA